MLKWCIHFRKQNGEKSIKRVRCYKEDELYKQLMWEILLLFFTGVMKSGMEKLANLFHRLQIVKQYSQQLFFS